MGKARWWVCDDCRSLNDVPANKCYNCRAGRPSHPTLIDDTYNQVGSQHRVGISVDRSRVKDLARPDPLETKKGGGIIEAFRRPDKGAGEPSTAPGQTLRVPPAQAGGSPPGTAAPRDEGLDPYVGTTAAEVSAPAVRPLRDPTPRSIADVGSRPWSDVPPTSLEQPPGVVGPGRPGTGEAPHPETRPAPPTLPGSGTAPTTGYGPPYEPNAPPPPGYAPPPGPNAPPPPGYAPPPGPNAVPPPGFVPPPGYAPPPGPNTAPPPGHAGPPPYGPPPAYGPPAGPPGPSGPPPPSPGYPPRVPVPGASPPWPPGSAPPPGYAPPSPPPAPPGWSEPQGPPAGYSSPPDRDSIADE